MINELNANPLSIYHIVNNGFTQASWIEFFDFCFDYVSIVWNYKIDDYAECNLRVRLTEQNKARFVPTAIVYRDAKRCFIVTTVVYNRGSDGELYIDVKGYTTNYLMTYRVLTGTLLYRTRSINAIVNDMFNQVFIRPTLADRRSYNVEYNSTHISPDTTTRLSSYSKTGFTLLEAIQELVTKDRMLHFRCDFNPLNMHFVCYLFYSVDRHTDVCFDDSTSSIASSSLTIDENGYKNYVYCYGEDTGTARRNVQYSNVDVVVNLLRRELYVDARDIQSTTYSPDGEQMHLDDLAYTQALTDRAIEKIKSFKRVYNYTAELRDTKLYKFEQEYDVGDIISINDRALGVDASETVTGFTETETAGSGIKLSVMVGQKKVDLKDSIKRLL
ncbi:MAG: siphovirus ReqiPepy6 Gp37-like family protein [Clostridia bacterium]|nr:siphovirus ReqiPepy6 Gp37-like family protein [Clostridia bacterium]